VLSPRRKVVELGVPVAASCSAGLIRSMAMKELPQNQ
jgi:hypothetical protein